MNSLFLVVRNIGCESLLLNFRGRRILYVLLHAFAHIRKDFIVRNRDLIVW